jgi:hypothetical protein
MTPRDLALAAAALIRASFVLGVTAKAASGGFIPSPEPPPQEEWHRIVGGAPTTEWPATVALLDDVGDGYAEFFCSGTLIRSDVVLTAAHCLEAATPDLVYFGTAPFDEEAGGHFVEVEDSLPHPGYTGQFDQHDDAWNDVGLVFLAADAPVEPVPERVGAQGPGIGATVWYVGFGQTEDPTADPLKKQELGEVEQWAADGLVTAQEDGSPCFGDSGGSLYSQNGEGTWQVTGVISFVTDASCDGEAGAIRSDRHDRWICLNAGPVEGESCPDDGDEPWADPPEEDEEEVRSFADDGDGCGAALAGRGDTWRMALAAGVWAFLAHRLHPRRRPGVRSTS